MLDISAFLDLLNSFLAQLCQLLMSAVQFLFGWLPDDPFIGYLGSVGADIALGVSWLNWIFPVDFLIVCLGLLVSIALPYAGWRIARPIIKYIFELIPG